jgi:hypothetical protein
MKRSYIAQLSYFLLKVYFLYNKFYGFLANIFIERTKYCANFPTKISLNSNKAKRLLVATLWCLDFLHNFFAFFIRSLRRSSIYIQKPTPCRIFPSRLWPSLIPKKHTWWWFISCPSVVSPLLVRPHLLRVHFFLRSQMAKQTHI